VNPGTAEMGVFYTPADTADYLRLVNMDMQTLNREITAASKIQTTKFVVSWRIFIDNWRDFFRRATNEDWPTWLQRGMGEMHANIARWVEKERAYKTEYERLTGMVSRAKPDERITFLQSITSTEDLGWKIALGVAGVAALYFWIRSR